MTDRLTPAQRSRLMSRIHGKDTAIEWALRSRLHAIGFRYRTHVRGLPGCPDLVFPTERVAVFVDGDFWHGYRFPQWCGTLPEFWQRKIENNRQRDRRTSAKLRRLGWKVVRIWGHELQKLPDACAERVTSAVKERRSRQWPAAGRRM